ncbi:MAG: carboxypeptidase-like regulatory domain-containing protein [Calditrichia bacterium]
MIDIQNWWKYVTGIGVVVSIVAGLAAISGYSLKDLFASSQVDSNIVTVLVHSEGGKDELILPSRGIVKLIYGDAIIPEQINNEGEATFKQIPDHFFNSNAKVEILFDDPKGEPYRAVNHDSAYQLIKGQYISLPVKLYGLEEINGIVKDFETGEPIKGARVSVQREETYSDEYGEYTLSIPPERQKQFQSIRASAVGYHLFEKDSIPPQTGREVPILMKPKVK